MREQILLQLFFITIAILSPYPLPIYHTHCGPELQFYRE